MKALKRYAINLYASRVAKQIAKTANSAIADQHKWRQYLIRKAANTQFGKDHAFSSIKTAADFSAVVPVRGYEDLRPYIDQITSGQKDILWPGKPKYFAKTSGTTSGTKYIPISYDSIQHHVTAASKMVMNYVEATKRPIFDGQLMFISGSPVLSEYAGIKTGRLSGIVNHEVPSWLKPNQLPSYSTNCIDNWEDKLDQIVEETYNKDLRLIGGIPPWVQMYYEKLLIKTGLPNIKAVFPNLELFVYGGVNYEPYRATFDKLHGGHMPSLETYPASEGFIAYQDDYQDAGLLLNTDAGMYFEFVPLSAIHDENPQRLTLEEVKLDVDYALLISSNAGLWAYNIGDTVRFTSLDPYKLRVSGRIKHFISAFGEHVITKEVEEAMSILIKKHGLEINEFSVAPQVNPPEGGLPYHEWFVEFEELPSNLDILAFDLDEEIARQNIYYHDLLTSNILQTLKIRPVKKHSFRRYMDSRGKLGGQNKIPRLMNTRELVAHLEVVA